LMSPDLNWARGGPIIKSEIRNPKSEITPKSRWALITGASSDIGLELARVFAGQGWNVLLVARDVARLDKVAGELRSATQVEALALPHDLARPGAAAEIFATAGHTPVSALVNNAGFGAYGEFGRISLDLQTKMMQVNMVALTELTHLFLQPMLSRREGHILNVASTAAFQPGPTVNVYYARKAFVYSFSYALAVELKGTGVTATAFCPGMTRTEFFERAGLRMRMGLAMPAREVARTGYEGMLKGRRVVIPGALNRMMSFLARRTPPAVTSAIVRRIHAPAQDACRNQPMQ